MRNLPVEFLSVIKNFLGEDYDAFAASYERKPFRGLRFNPLKIDVAETVRLMPFSLSPAPFCQESFYFDASVQGIGSHHLHHGGAYYVQEPSAAAPVTVLDPQPGDRVLDLCAAPGGKATQIGAALEGRGILWANEIVKSRANILLANLERLGIRNNVVSSCHPEVLCGKLSGWFDKVLVDAPCSGEGMFRREPEAVREWSPSHSQACAQRQKAILHTAAKALRQGGILVYSTCTFSPAENEEVVEDFLKEHPDFLLLPCGVSFGREGKVPQTRRILPMDGGEGHFMAKFQRVGENAQTIGTYEPRTIKKEIQGMIDGLMEQVLLERLSGIPVIFGENVLLLPQGLPELSGLGVLRAGVPVGELKKGRLEPAHGLFLAGRPKRFRQVLKLKGDDPRVRAFLHGEEIDAPGVQGYAGIAADGVMLGFGKCSGGRMKNRYPKGLRNL